MQADGGAIEKSNDKAAAPDSNLECSKDESGAAAYEKASTSCAVWFDMSGHTHLPRCIHLL